MEISLPFFSYSATSNNEVLARGLLKMGWAATTQHPHVGGEYWQAMGLGLSVWKYTWCRPETPRFHLRLHLSTSVSS